jgi:UPF0755 protein
LTTSPPKRRARAIPAAVFPTAVGPATTIKAGPSARDRAVSGSPAASWLLARGVLARMAARSSVPVPRARPAHRRPGGRAVIQALVHSLKIVTIVATAVLVAFGGRSFFDYYTDREADPRLGQPYNLQVAEDDDADSLAAELSAAGLIRSALVFKTEMRLTSGVLQPGFYTLRYGMSVRDIVDVITVNIEEGDDEKGDQAEARLVEVTYPEGWRIEQIAEAYGDAGLEGGYEGFLEATGNISTRRYEFLKDRPKGASLEGYLFPDTYKVGSNSAPEDMIYYMLDNFDAQFTPAMRRRAEEMDLTIHQVLTLASLVEREAAVDEERPIIAAVYLNRLEVPMQLQADPTVVYVIGTEDEWWPQLEPNQQYAEGIEDNPYNTYTHDGLPPGPICNPGIASIKAVLYPEDVDYLYFVAKNDDSGTHAFATTLEEHEANLDKYVNNEE